jgi:hypothetical protein
VTGYSYFGRVNYEFAGKFATATVRYYDGTSQFAPGYQFVCFRRLWYWRLSERFRHDIPTISNLEQRQQRLKAGRFAYLHHINSGITFHPFGPNVALTPGSAPTRSAANDVLRWETTTRPTSASTLAWQPPRNYGSRRVQPPLAQPISNVPPYLVTGTAEPAPTNALRLQPRLDLSINTSQPSGRGYRAELELALTFHLPNEVTDLA